MNLVKSIKNHEFFRSAMSVGMGNLLAQVINIVTIPIISRLYSEEMYGEFGVIVSAAMIIVNISTLGLNSAIMVPEKDEEAKQILTLTFYIQFVITICVVCGGILLTSKYKFFEISLPYRFAMFIMGIYIILTNINSLLITYTNRLRMNKILFVNPIIGAISKLVITIPLGFMNVGFIGFMGAALLSLICTCSQMIIRTNPFYFKLTITKVIELLRKYKEYIIFQYPSNFVSNFATQLPIQIFSKIFGNGRVGSYSMCIRLLQYPAVLIASPIGTVYFRTVSQYYREGKNIADFTYNLIKKIMMIAFIPCAIIICYGKELFSIFLGSQWEEAGILASVLIVQYVMQFCATCTSYCRVALGRQKINLYYSVFQLLISVVFIGIGWTVFENFVETISCFSVGITLILIVDMALNFYCLKKNLSRYLIFVSIYFLAIGCIFAIKHII